MLELTRDDVAAAGGILAALAARSEDYLRTLIAPGDILAFGDEHEHLERLILHREPHLDEYVAQLLFRVALPAEARGLPLQEQALFSKDNDLISQHLWPESAVFGIGRAASGGASALFIFDEHTLGGQDSEPSCAEVVRQVCFRELPASVATVLREVNVIDQYGNAHPQHLGNVVKTMHQVQFWFSKGATPRDHVRDTLGDSWKRALVDASIAAIVYCLAEGVSLAEPDAIKACLKQSLEAYADGSLHSGSPGFVDTANFYRGTYLDVPKVFAEAVLRGSPSGATDPVKDTDGTPMPQLLLLSRVCFACTQCWGQEVASAIMMHYWEAEFQQQLSFCRVRDALKGIVSGQGLRGGRTDIGSVEARVLDDVQFDVEATNKKTGKIIRSRRPLWVIALTPNMDVIQPHKAAQHFVNTQNHGVGLVLVENSRAQTRFLAAAQGVPSGFWTALAHTIAEREPGHWHMTTNPTGIARFILNGNQAHQYVPKSGLDADAVASVARRAFGH